LSHAPFEPATKALDPFNAAKNKTRAKTRMGRMDIRWIMEHFSYAD
jgi:hypothetical protein